MSQLERDIKIFILKILLAARGEPMTDDILKRAVNNAYQHVAITSDDLNGYVKDCEAERWISGTNDEMLGPVWSLTPKGKIRAQQLR